MTLDDLKAVQAPIGILLIELPQREIGGMLPSWDNLTEIVAYARECGMFLHLDGARLWESQPFYDRSYAEICDLFDTVYVSFYKVLNGISSAMLLGESPYHLRKRKFGNDGMVAIYIECTLLFYQQKWA